MHKEPDYPSNSIKNLKSIVKSLEKFSNENGNIENEVNTFGSDVNYYVEELIDYIQKLQEYSDYVQCSLAQTINLISTDLLIEYPDVVSFPYVIEDAYESGLEFLGLDRVEEKNEIIIHKFSYIIANKNKFALFALKQ